VPSPAKGFLYEYDLVAAKLDCEILALDAFRAVRQAENIRYHIIFALARANGQLRGSLQCPSIVTRSSGSARC
jgi:hypothetical protein